MSFYDLQPTVRFDSRQLGWLGQATSADLATLSSLGFDSSQIATITSAEKACTLSPQGYSYLLTGGVDPSDLADFLNNDPGCGTVQNTGGRVLLPNVNAQLSINPSPTVMEPGFFGWLAQPSFFGVSNGAMLSLGVLGLLMFSGGRFTSGYTVTKRRRR
jgi:hypothetical protein